MGHLDHKAASPAVVHCYILTVSDTRTEATDTSGRAIFDLLFAGGHQVAGRKIVRDEPDEVARGPAGRAVPIICACFSHNDGGQLTETGKLLKAPSAIIH